MRTQDIAIDYKQKPTTFQVPDGTPECSFTTPWLLRHHGSFRVYVAVVRPQSEKPQDDLSLSRRETKNALKALANTVIGLEETLRWQDSVS